ncbi:hypothetical protein [Laspinema palackyanum]|uniref:hypothetical protein n=1 Tax=Laspinema palackyanum TaxID=3231601 RepID=UPI00345D42D4|nr:Uma2 family endonuclease [Laspinema sp. D2c]
MRQAIEPKRRAPGVECSGDVGLFGLCVRMVAADDGLLSVSVDAGTVRGFGMKSLKILVLEIDITSYSDVQDYLPYQVPEVWLFRNPQLMIYQLQGNEYGITSQSQYFPALNPAALIAQCLQIADQRNTSAAIRDLKQQLGG